ncbi:fused MFS/spermidine synthase [Paenibacillus allorhizosphaerae]|uniref:Polyamine aminopropyltransferase n=1 Tax=Paenibacillus allorhizosphaerae TaxID=2849866 RepID=A0ABM8VSG3_9BACL|nr:fused MFS/spermidine synthase [Paenibacillus allorhizosphaerae]CAG7656441.1 Polyamine aminopropyltransferase [Paenibacillus allorhizosphaerae]
MIALILFLASYVYMGFEMLASRILGPYFGSGITVWACIISVFLIGSSIGYLLGGKTADMKESKRYIRIYLFWAAVSVSVAWPLSRVTLPLLSEEVNMASILLQTSLLFLIPSILSSAVIPGLMKMGIGEKTDGAKIGIYHMVVSVGSVAGTLITTFYLLPEMRLQHIMIVFALIYFLSWFVMEVKWYKLCLFVIAFIPLLDIGGARLGTNPILEQVSTPYHDIFITESSEYNGQAGDYVFMQFDTHALQGAIDKNNRSNILFSYIRETLHIVDSYHPQAENIFMIGHGAGILTNALQQSGKNIEVAELDPKVLELSCKYFGYAGDRVAIGDGRVILNEKRESQYDIVILDAFKAEGVPFHLLTQDFFQLVQRKLKPSGIVVINMIGAIEGDSLIEDVTATAGSVFNNVKTIARYDDKQMEQNILYMLSQQPLDTIKASEYKEVTTRAGKVITDQSINNRKLQ